MDDNDLGWPRREPENWRGIDVSRNKALETLDLLLGEIGNEALANALDEAQAAAEDGHAFLLVRIVDGMTNAV